MWRTSSLPSLLLLLAIGCSGTNHEPSTPDDDLGVGTSSVSFVSAVGVNKYVDACVAAVIQRTKFPEPTGGAVQVTRDFYGVSNGPNGRRDQDD